VLLLLLWQSREKKVERAFSTAAVWRAHAGVGDLARALARLQASTLAEAEGANAAIYYEDTAKRRVLSVVAALRGLQSVQAHPAYTIHLLLSVSIYCLPSLLRRNWKWGVSNQNVCLNNVSCENCVAWFEQS
jgi:hypothetical protein